MRRNSNKICLFFTSRWYFGILFSLLFSDHGCSGQTNRLHISPHPDNKSRQESNTFSNNLFWIDIDGIGPGREFYDSDSLSIQLVEGGPAWIFYSKSGNSSRGDENFVGETLDGKVTCSLVRYYSNNNNNKSQHREVLVGVVQDLESALWYDIKPNFNGEDTVTVIRDEDIPESSDPTMLPEALVPDEGDSFDDDDDDDQAGAIAYLSSLASAYLGTSNNNNPSSLLATWMASSPEEDSTSQGTDDGSTDTVIDALVIWTRRSECVKSNQQPDNDDCILTEETHVNMEAAVALMASETNTVYRNSGLGLTLNIRHSQREPTSRYEEKGFPRTLLYASTNLAIRNLRYEHDADIVIFIIDNSVMGSVSGMAYNNFLTPGKRGWMFAVVGAQYTSLRYVAAHEVGHLFGCFHDRGTQDGCTSADTNWGHRDSEGRYVTVMAYRCQLNQCDNLTSYSPCARIPYFSGNITYNGELLGGEYNNCRGQILATKDMVASILPKEEGILECFSPDVVVQVFEMGRVAMKDLRVGDRVLASSGRYETVYLMDHYHPTKQTNYVQIHTNSSQDNKPLEVTPLHMLFVEGKTYPVPAKDIQEGDHLHTLDGPVVVTKMASVARNGLYNPLTMDGTIVVDGIVASTYSAVTEGTNYLEIAGRKIVPYQTLIHLLMEPYRVSYKMMNLWAHSKRAGSREVNDSLAEIHWYAGYGRTLASWWQRQNAVIQSLTLVMLLLLLGALHISLNILRYGVIAVVLLLVIHAVTKRNGNVLLDRRTFRRKQARREQ